MKRWFVLIALFSTGLLLRASAWSKSSQVSNILCRSAFASHGALFGHITEEDRLKVMELLDGKNLIHYSNLEGAIGLLKLRRMIADRKNRVFFTHEGFSPQEAEQNLFLGSPTHQGRGDYVLILRPEEGHTIRHQEHLPYEYVVEGSYRFRKEDVLYFGPNPF